MSSQKITELSVVMPAFNEEKVVEKTVKELKGELQKLGLVFEIIVVDDGSKDRTPEILKKIPDITVIRHPQNLGNGAAIKTGIKNSRYDKILTFDADGQHRPEFIKDLLAHAGKYEMVAGARHGYKGPLIRQPGKRVLHWLVNYLTSQKIPDINCGLRIIGKKHILRFENMICDGFSFYTTSLLIFLGERLPVKFVPIKINKRVGKSMVRPRHALDTFILIIKTVTFFSPLKVFLPVSSLLFIVASVSLVYDFFFRNGIDISEGTIMVFLSSLLIFFFGLMADQLALIRKEIHRV